MATAQYQYDSFGTLFECNNASDIHQSGVYRIDQPGLRLDVLAQGLVHKNVSDPILVFFGGAVRRDGKIGPFFSGRGISRKLELPILSISDPTLELSDSLRIGWYAGSPDQIDLPGKIAALLDDVSRLHSSKLILVGGSAGGFAVLNVMQHINEPSQGIVWNPQTRISEYHRRHVSDYVEIFTGAVEPLLKPRQAQAAFDIAGISSDVTKSIMKGDGVLYLQNASDKHVERHMRPVTNHGTWHDVSENIMNSESRKITICLGNWGDGHVAYPKDDLIEAIEAIRSGESTLDLAQSISQKYPTMPSEMDEGCLQ